MSNIFPPRNWVRTLYAYKGTGLPRIAELIRKIQAKRHPNTEVIINDFGGAKFVCRLSEHMGSQIYWRGAYSGAQLMLLSSQLQPESVFIDLGANQGEFTIFAASLVGNNGRVYAFEPSPPMQQQLLRNVKLNDFSQVYIEPMAVADKPGDLFLYSPVGQYEDGTTHDGLPSLYAQASTPLSSATKVSVTTLDAWLTQQDLTRVDLIKMDIEGAELPALKGGVGLIQRFRPALIIELNAATSSAAGYTMQDLLAWLHAQNYDIFCIEEDSRLSPLNINQLASFQNIFASPRL